MIGSIESGLDKLLQPHQTEGAVSSTVVPQPQAGWMRRVERFVNELSTRQQANRLHKVAVGIS